MNLPSNFSLLTFRAVILVSFSLLLGSCGEPTGQKEEDATSQATDDKDHKDKTAEGDRPANSSIKIDQKATQRAHIFAAQDLTDTQDFAKVAAMPAVQNRKAKFNEGWKHLDDTYLAPLRKWRDSEISDFSKKGNNLFYPFSGPDFLNAYNLFPDMDNYVMIGLEKVGELPKDFDQKDEKYINNYLHNIDKALEDIFARNYFITSYMGSDLYRVAKGVLPIINVFMVRTGNEIVSIKRAVIGEDGKPVLKDITAPDEASDDVVTGLMIEFKNKDKDYTQKIYYFGLDISDQNLQNQKMEFDKFLRSFPNKYGYLKSASYVLFNTGFKVINNIIKDDVQGVLQDDTGAPYREYVKSGNWDIQLYGNYATPIADFGKYTHQPDLRQAFADPANKVKKLGFPYGYQWRDINKVSLLVIRRKK